MLVGITGGIGSGKSTICRALAQRGYPIYDTDSRAKELIIHHPEVRQQMIALFGEDIYDEDVYFTAKVAEQVFAHPDLLARLNAIVHPAVRQDILQWQKSLAHSISFVESAILFSSGLNLLCDYTVCIDAPESVRIARTIRRDGTDINKVRARIHAQKNEADLCDLVLCNDGKTPIAQLLDCLETHIQTFHAVR